MADQPKTTSIADLSAIPGLERFVDRLSPGMELNGRIVDILDDNILILRVWGNNILTESKYKFNKFDEVILQVQAVRPKLVFRIQPTRHQENNGAIYA